MSPHGLHELKSPILMQSGDPGLLQPETTTRGTTQTSATTKRPSLLIGATKRRVIRHLLSRCGKRRSSKNEELLTKALRKNPHLSSPTFPQMWIVKPLFYSFQNLKKFFLILTYYFMICSRNNNDRVFTF